MRLTLTPQTLPRVESYNVIADWKSSEHLEQIVIASAHLDSWDLGTGAIDDGAGVVVSMQVIHPLKQLGIHPKRTVRFIACGWTKSKVRKAHRLMPRSTRTTSESRRGSRIRFGRRTSRGLSLCGQTGARRMDAPGGQALESIGASTVTHSREVGTHVDPLNEKGIPGFSPAQDSRFYFNYHHTAADTFDKVDARELNETRP